MKCDITFVHPIAGRIESASRFDVRLPDGAASNRNTMAKALREAGILPSGVPLREMRLTDDGQAHCFPRRGNGACVWHCISLHNFGQDID